MCYWARLENTTTAQLVPQEFRNILWKSQIDYRIRNSRQISTSRGRCIHFTLLHNTSLISHLILSIHLYLVLPNNYFSSILITNFIYIYIYIYIYLYSSYPPCLLLSSKSNPLWSQLFNYTWQRVKFMNFLITQVFSTPPPLNCSTVQAFTSTTSFQTSWVYFTPSLIIMCNASEL
jgi:hypothetical protein